MNSSMFARVPGPADRLEIDATISAYGDGDDRGDGLDHRRRGLATAGDHVDVHRVEVEVEVDRRAEVRPDSGRREVDGEDAGLGVARCVRRVRLGRGALEDDVGQLVLGEQPVDALVAGLEAERPGAAQPVGCRVDPDHPAWVEHVAAAHQLEHQVGADVAGPDDGGGALGPGGGRHGAPQTNRAVTLPSPANVAVKVSPAATADMAQTAPGSTTWPGLEGDAAGADGVGEPDERVDRRAEHGAAGTGADDLAVAVEGRPGQAQVDRADVGRGRPEHHGAGAGVVGDGVEQADLPVADPAVDDLQRR